MKLNRLLATALLGALAATTIPSRTGDVTPAEARAIAKEAYIHGFPMVAARAGGTIHGRAAHLLAKGQGGRPNLEAAADETRGVISQLTADHKITVLAIK